jgi:CXXX repeat peptide maturase
VGCRRCDAYQCRRCIWLNRKLTREVNTPSHEQCVVAHLERNASRILLANIRKANPNFLAETKIEEIDYLDPFEMKREK